MLQQGVHSARKIGTATVLAWLERFQCSMKWDVQFRATQNHVKFPERSGWVETRATRFQKLSNHLLSLDDPRENIQRSRYFMLS